MTITISWTLPVDDSVAASGEPMDRDRLWAGLLHKAEHPVSYVPAITSATVLERNGGSFLRTVVRNGRVITQRVTPEPARDRIVFRHVDDPDVAAIVNQISVDTDGLLALTIEVLLTPERSRRLVEGDAFLRSTDEYFTATIAAIVDALHTSAPAARACTDR